MRAQFFRLKSENHVQIYDRVKLLRIPADNYKGQCVAVKGCLKKILHLDLDLYSPSLTLLI